MEVAKKSWRVEQGHRMRTSGLLLYGRYTKLQSAVGDDDDRHQRTSSSSARSDGVILGRNAAGTKGQHRQQRPAQKKHRKRRWGFKVRPRVRVHCSTLFALLRRLRDSYTRGILALAAKARDSSLFPLASSKRTPLKATVPAATPQLNAVETKYMEYIKRSVTDGELAYYTLSLRNAGLF